MPEEKTSFVNEHGENGDIMEAYEFEDNQFVNDASYDGKMFETYGSELEYIINIVKEEQKNNIPNQGSRVWTIIEASNDDSEDLIVYSNGYHLVNRIGYLVSITPGKPNEEFTDNLSEMIGE